jgi:hypothetical protein
MPPSPVCRRKRRLEPRASPLSKLLLWLEVNKRWRSVLWLQLGLRGETERGTSVLSLFIPCYVTMHQLQMPSKFILSR